VGSFGAPGPSKLTELVIEACALLRRSRSDVRLTLAGYDMDRYLAERRSPLPSWADAYDNPSRAEIERLMARTTIAVQLRREGLGESSGAIADLAAIGTPTIVSDVGAMAELATAGKVAADVTAEQLASVIERAARAPRPSSVDDLSPAAFWRLIESRLPAPAAAPVQLAGSSAA
jgi:glycosyltransferase involved in cell wall biosynthesis